MEEGEIAFLDQVERARKHLLGLGREARDDVSAEHHVGAQPSHLITECNRVGAQMAPLHALEDEIVTGLQREMQMRHQPLLFADQAEQVRINLHNVEGGEPQPFQLRHQGKNAPHQLAEARRAAVASAGRARTR